jgi:hypothetical protein
MTNETRALRNLREDIAHAHEQLKWWRREGKAERIAFWAERLDELVDRLPRSAKPKETAQ